MRNAAILCRRKWFVGPQLIVGLLLISCEPSPVTTAPRKVGVIVGADFLQRQFVYESALSVWISDLAVGDLIDSPGIEVGIAGSDGVEILDHEFGVLRSIRVDIDSLWNYFVYTDYDFSEAFVSEGFQWAVYNLAGRKLFSTELNPELQEMEGTSFWAGDLDADGRLEYIYIESAYDYSILESDVYLLNSGGRIVREAEIPEGFGMAGFIECVNVDGHGSNEIVLAGQSGSVFIMDAHLQIRNRYSLPHADPIYSEGGLIKLPGANKDELNFCYASGDQIFIVSLANQIKKSYPMRIVNEFSKEFVRFDPADDPYFVALGGEADQGSLAFGIESFSTSLKVFDARGEVVYQENSGKPPGALAAFPVSGSAEEKLLVSLGEFVYLYSKITEESQSNSNPIVEQK